MNVLYDHLFAPHAQSNAPFLIIPGGDTVIYRAFVGRAAQFAHRLAGLGIRPGDRVAVQIAKSPDALALYAGCVQCGAIFLPLNTAYTASEVSYFVENSGATLFICQPDREDELRREISADVLTLGANGDGTFCDTVASLPTMFETVARSGDDLAAFLYTSGTTGRSKGAMLTHDNLLSNARTLRDLWRFTDQDVLFHALPIFHTHGLFVGTNITLLAGGAMIFVDRFDPGQAIQELPNATTMMGVPTFYTRLLADPAFDATCTGSMRLFISGSAPLLADTHRQFETRTGHRILERYGMTETNMSTSNPYDGDRRAGTVGLPLPDVEVKVCDANGDELPRGEIGILEVRGPNVFAGYWQMPDKTAEDMRDTGFFITGDLAKQSADGYVEIVGRGKDLIISGGYNVYPKEIEDVLDQVPGVLESAVIGVPHPDFGEVGAALLVADGDAIDMDLVAAQLASKLAKFKRPKHLEQVAQLPRNTMGKVQKAAMRRDYETLFVPD